MDYKYFGDIECEDFAELPMDEQYKVLTKKDYITSTNKKSEPYIEKHPKDVGLEYHYYEIYPDKYDYNLNYNVAKDFYGFILNHYKSGLGANNVFFFKKFNTQCFGLNKDEIRKIALKYFNSIFYECCPKGEEVKDFDYKTGIVENHRRFFTLKSSRFNLINLLGRSRDLFIPYLTGNKDFFDRELYENNPVIRKIILFENDLITLIALNNKFNFEVDQYFSIKSKSVEILEKYDSKIDSIEVVYFIEECLSNTIYRKRNYGLALFECLSKELNVIRLSANDFKDLCNTFFDCNFKDLKLGNRSNRHIENVEFLKKEWFKLKD